MSPETVEVAEKAAGRAFGESGGRQPKGFVRNAGWLVLGLAALFLAIWLSPAARAFEGLTHYLPLHTALETFAVVVAALVFAVGWNACIGERSGNIVWLSCAFLAVALLDFGHLMSYKGMPDFVTPSGAQKGIYFWLAARLVAALGLLVAVFRPWRPLKAKSARPALILVALAVTAGVYWVVLYHETSLPPVFIEGRGLTGFKIGVEWGIIALNGLTVAALLARRANPRPFDGDVLLAAVIVMTLSELCFTLYTSVTDAFNLLGHLYKVIAYFFVYQAVFVASVREPYQRLRLSERLVWQEKERALVTLESIGDGVITTDAGGRVEYLNPVAENLTGWRNAEAAGLPLQQVFHIVNEHTRERVENPLERCLREGHVIGLANHTLLVRRDGQEVAIEDSAAPILDREDRIIGAILVFHDVSERRRAQAALQDSETQLRTLINAMPDIVCFKDGEGCWLEANDFNLRLFQLENVPYKGKKDAELAQLTRSYREALLACGAADEAAWRAGQPVRQEQVIPRPDGTTMTFDVIRVPLFNADGSRKGLVVVGRDVTEMARLQNEKLQLVNILEATPDFVSILTVDGFRTYLNRTGRKWLGFREGQDITGLPELQAYPEWVQPMIWSEAIPTAISKGMWQGETIMQTHEGQ